MKEKFLIVGLGSMGKRRLRNLLDLGYLEIIGYDMRSDRVEEVIKKYKIKAVTDFNKALQFAPTSMIISSPPNLLKIKLIIVLNAAVTLYPVFTEILNTGANTNRWIKDVAKPKLNKVGCRRSIEELQKLFKDYKPLGSS